MELDAVHPQLSMAHGHDLAVRRGRRHLELVGDASRRERVIAPGLELAGKPTEEPEAVVVDRPGLAVDEGSRRTDLAAEDLDDRLMAETHAECRNARGKPPDDLEGCARLFGPSRPGRDHEL